MADALMKYETIDEAQLEQLMNGEDCDPPKGWMIGLNLMINQLSQMRHQLPMPKNQKQPMTV